MNQKEIKVWDLFIRFFHWSLVITFAVAFLTEDDMMLLHSWAGYIMTGLIGVRIVYGFVGTRYARFTNFIYKPTTIVNYAVDVMLFKAPRYLGHNPAGGLMIMILLISLLLTCFSGMIALAVEDHAGPFASNLSLFPSWIVSVMEEFHEFIAYFSLLMVATHIAGVLIESIVHQENLTRSMINGKKRV